MRKLLLSMLTTLLLTGLLGGGALALFQDTETSSGNTFTAGTLDLKIKDQDEAYGDGVTATWTASNMAPGDSWNFVAPFVRLDAQGSIAPNHVEITCDYSVIEEVPQTEADTDPNTNLDPDKMAKVMVITRCIYRDGSWSINCLTDTNPKWRIQDQDGDGRRTFYDLKNDPLDDLPPPNGATTEFQLGVKFHENAGNDFQGDTFNLSLIFTLNQDSSQ